MPHGQLWCRENRLSLNRHKGQFFAGDREAFLHVGNSTGDHPKSAATGERRTLTPGGVPTRFLHDYRRTAARNLIRANVPERVAMLLTGHKSRAIFDRYNIIHEQELLDAGDQLVAYLAQPVPARRRPHAVGTAAPRPAPALRLVRRGTA